MGFNLIYWTPICGKHFLDCSILKKMWKYVEKQPFFPGGYGRIGEILQGLLRPDWGNTARAATAGLRSKGLNENGDGGMNRRDAGGRNVCNSYPRR